MDPDFWENMYEKGVLSVLAQYQIIEELMKQYIGIAYKIIKGSVHEKMTFGHIEEEVTGLPYGRLLKIFKKLNNNKELHKKIADQNIHRNHIAHRALLHYQRKSDANEFEEDTHDLKERMEVLDVLVNELLNEYVEISDVFEEVVDEYANREALDQMKIEKAKAKRKLRSA